MEGGGGGVRKAPQLPCSQKKVGRVCLKRQQTLDEVKILGRKGVEHLGRGALSSLLFSKPLWGVAGPLECSWLGW